MTDATSENYDPKMLPDLLPLYYKRIFPHKLFCQWLSYGFSEEGVFANREISFTMNDNIYIRHMSFETGFELEKEICTKNPFKIDIGAVLNTRPNNFRATGTSMIPIQRELVFDIDMTDYDDVRTCCGGADICQKCWKLMAIATRIIDSILRDDFGFEQILWVFSGRRGIHCWVCDFNARHLDSQGRLCLAEYVQIVTSVLRNGSNVAHVQLGDRIHHSARRALKFIVPLFEEIVLEDQNLFGTRTGILKLTQMISDEQAREDLECYLRKSLREDAHSKEVWTTFTRYVNQMRNTSSNIWNRRLKHIIEEIQLCIMYPRIDINVTKGFNHLLKAPFCIHPVTGKVCIPFNPNNAAKFDPTNVPTVIHLLKDLNDFDNKFKSHNGTSEEKSRIKEYKKTSIFKGVVVFEEFLRKLENNYKQKIILSDKQIQF